MMTSCDAIFAIPSWLITLCEIRRSERANLLVIEGTCAAVCDAHHTGRIGQPNCFVRGRKLPKEIFGPTSARPLPVKAQACDRTRSLNSSNHPAPDCRRPGGGLAAAPSGKKLVCKQTYRFM